MFNLESLNLENVRKLTVVDYIPKLKLKDQYVMTDDVMKILEIPKMEIEYDGKVFPEIWTYCKFDGKNKEYTKERNYIVSTYGRIYDLVYHRLKIPHNSSAKSCTATGERYQIVNMKLDVNNIKPIAVHRLVALAFLKKVKRKNVVDHIDEHPAHNYVWNLQWTDKSGNSNKHNMYVQRERTGRAVDTTWKYEELVAICKMMAEGHKATYIYNEMLKITNNNPKIQYERIRTLYKHIMKRGDFHDIAVKCGVNFDCNTLKEKGSVARIQEIKNNN